MGLLEKQVAAELAQWSGFKAAGLGEKKIAEGLARPPKPDMGDLAFATFRYAKDAGSKPNDFAAQLVAGKPAASKLIAKAEAAGPYVNVHLNHAAVTVAVLGAIESATPGNDPTNWRFGDSNDGNGKTLIVDLSSPNIAKPLAVHHLRSTMIGYSIKKIRESQGWRVVGINHLGDWGTGFGKLIAGIRKYHPSSVGIAHSEAMRKLLPDGRFRRYSVDERNPLEGMTVVQLNEFYRRVNEEMRKDDELEEAGRQEFAVLEKHIRQLAEHHPDEPTLTAIEGEENFRLWRAARELSLGEFQRIYKRLGCQFFRWNVYGPNRKRFLSGRWRDLRFQVRSAYIGESFYVGASDLAQRVILEAQSRGIATMSEGALVVESAKKGEPPVMLLKSDGATTYHARDIASAIYRYEQFVEGTHSILGAMAYVVGGEQKLHFEQLFNVLKLLQYNWAEECTHVDFGLMLFQQPDGKWAKTSTRRGTAIMLENLLDEAIKSVREIIAEKNPELAADQAYAEQVAQAVGTGAVVFNDLKQGRRNNIKFDWDAVLDFQGESGPYMQMQYVRMCSVLDKFVAESKQRYGRALTTEDLGTADLAQLGTEEEWKIVLQLAAFPDAIAKASDEFEPSVVSRYLIELASLTSTWWTVTKDTRIVGDDAQLSLARVRLVNAIRKVLGRGLTLLGMTLVERM